MAAAGGMRGKEGRRYNRDSDQTRQMTLPQGRGRVEKQVSHENLQMKEENTSNHHADFIDPPWGHVLRGDRTKGEKRRESEKYCFMLPHPLLYHHRLRSSSDLTLTTSKTHPLPPSPSLLREGPPHGINNSLGQVENLNSLKAPPPLPPSLPQEHGRVDQN